MFACTNSIVKNRDNINLDVETINVQDDILTNVKVSDLFELDSFVVLKKIAHIGSG